MKITGKRFIFLMLVLLLIGSGLFTGCSNGEGSGGKVALDPENPVSISVWHYYNGDQQKAFNQLVSEFNDTYGREKGIIVESFGLGNVSDLETSVLESVNRKVGAAEMPNIFAAYADTAYAVDQLGLAVDLSPYLTEEEKGRFIQSYLEEGSFSDDGSLKIFPIAKSTEIFMLNKTDWDKFSAATGADLSQLETIEGVTETAEAYYQWTDSLTPEPEDGRAFFGRDAMANYFLIGAMQQGCEIFSVENGKPSLHFDKDVVRSLWDHYYIPYVKGYFAASGRFRSDDIKTGTIISFVGSSSGATFFPNQVIVNDEESYAIDTLTLQAPQFAGGERYAVQQGAGMVVTKTSEEEILASVEFLKWFTQDDRNIQYSIGSGYLPVTRTASSLEAIERNKGETPPLTLSIIRTAINTITNNTLYTTKAFENGTSARSILEYSMSDKAAEDRKAVKEKLAQGMTLEEAVSGFDNDQNFEAWYASTKAELETFIQ